MNRIAALSLVVIFCLRATTASATDNTLQPQVAIAAQVPLAAAIDKVSILQGLMQDSANWYESKFQSAALDRLFLIQIDMLDLLSLLQQAASGTDFSVGLAIGKIESITGQFQKILQVTSYYMVLPAYSAAGEISEYSEATRATIDTGDLPGEICGNGIDDDGDGLVDDKDPECEPTIEPG